MNDICYGIKGEDCELLGDLEDIFIRRLADRDLGTSATDFLDLWNYPIKVLEFKRADAKEYTAANRASHMLNDILEDLDGDYAVENPSAPTPAMEAAALTLWTVILSEYIPERCYETGNVIEISREELAHIIDPKGTDQ